MAMLCELSAPFVEAKRPIVIPSLASALFSEPTAIEPALLAIALLPRATA